jgi:glycine cleavage system H protein
MITNSSDMLELVVDKFIFRFPKSLKYSDAGLWIKQEGGLLRIGITDFAQQRNGDIAFANMTPAGTALNEGDEIAVIETVKVNISLPSPLAGKIMEVNSLLDKSPELINQDPYREGWMAVIQPESPEKDFGKFLPAESYLMLVKEQAEAELKS